MFQILPLTCASRCTWEAILRREVAGGVGGGAGAVGRVVEGAGAGGEVEGPVEAAGVGETVGGAEGGGRLAAGSHSPTVVDTAAVPVPRRYTPAFCLQPEGVAAAVGGLLHPALTGVGGASQHVAVPGESSCRSSFQETHAEN